MSQHVSYLDSLVRIYKGKLGVLNIAAASLQTLIFVSSEGLRNAVVHHKFVSGFETLEQNQRGAYHVFAKQHLLARDYPHPHPVPEQRPSSRSKTRFRDL